MKHDIRSREDIEILVIKFYDQVKSDKDLAYIFNDIARVDWSGHLQLMNDFWSNVLFYDGSYAGNPMEVHRQLHQKFELKEEHFKRWISLFNLAVDSNFEGENAILIKKRANNISQVLQTKIKEIKKA